MDNCIFSTSHDILKSLLPTARRWSLRMRLRITWVVAVEVTWHLP